jgi:hypothetical protein
MTFNIHTVYQVGGEISGDIPLRPVGTAVYSRTVMFNHSCAVNTARFYVGGSMIVVAKRFIGKGEEVANNYGFHHCQERYPYRLILTSFYSEADRDHNKGYVRTCTTG